MSTPNILELHEADTQLYNAIEDDTLHQDHLQEIDPDPVNI